MVTNGLIPRDVFPILVQEAAVQYDQEILWLRQKYDDNGDSIENSYSEKDYEDPQTLDARVVKVDREFIDSHGYHLTQVTQWYIPPNTGVRYGDILIGKNDNPSNPPPVMSVSEVPSPEFSIYELVTTGWRSKGAP